MNCSYVYFYTYQLLMGLHVMCTTREAWW